jgi:hypothetical protein
MILFEDGRRFTIAGTVLSDGTTIIPFSAITVGEKPNSFPIPVVDVVPPIIYVELIIVGDGTILAAMSVMEYNKIALAQAQRSAPIPSQPLGLINRAANFVARTCGSCGKR